LRVVELARLIHELSLPGAYPEGTGPIEVRQTHISVVFLAGSHVYKVKKPVKLGFLDFSTSELRRVACFDEVRLNRRLAPDVYLGVSPIVLGPSGLVFDGNGEPVDWAVKMRRLPDDASLLARLGRGELTPEVIERVAARLAAFHAEAERSPSSRTFGGLDAVAKNAQDNF
jgi:aminoglycoside phosphotransferase family enzyme